MLPAAKAFTLAERDKHMSEQKTSFMTELDAWTKETVIEPLYKAWNADSEDFDQETFAQVRHAIREKVLESYRNGQAAAAVVKGRPSNFRPQRQSAK